MQVEHSLMLIQLPLKWYFVPCRWQT